MAQSYTRQSSFSDGDTITAALFNNEYDQLVNAFIYSSSSASSTGHRHDGTAGQGGNVPQIGDLDFLNKIVVDDSNNRWGFFVEVSSAAVEQIRIQDGAIVPVTDNDIDLGTSSLEFKDAYFDGTVTSDAFAGPLTGDVTGTADVATSITVSANNSTDETVYPLFVDGATGSQGGETDTGFTYNPSSGNLTIGGALTSATLDISGNADIDGTLEADAYTVDGTALNEYIADTVGAMVTSNTETNITVTYDDSDNTLDFVATGTVTALNNATENELVTVGATTTELDAESGLTYNGSTLAVTGSVTVSTDVDVDGTMEADAITVDGTALNEYIADTVGAMVSSNTESGITVAYQDGDNTLDFTVGTLNQDTTGTADNITISANNSTDETVYPIFVDGATGSQGAESDTGLTYNPSSGLLTTTLLAGTLNTAAQTNITSLGTLTALTVDNVVIDGAVIGHTGDTDLITLSSGVVTVAGEVDATSLDISGNADIDGTLEADAITIDDVALNEYIADTVGAMVGSNTETGITVTYEDGDNTLDFVIGTLNQDTTGTASKVTVTDSTANTNFPVVFHDEGTGNVLLDDTGALRYNPSSGELLVPNLTVAGTTTTVDTVTMNAQNAIIFEGATADANETTLSIVDPTSDHTQYLINQGGYIPVLAAATTTQISATPAEINVLDGVTAGTVSASLGVVVDSNKDIGSFRNVTLTGELDAGSLDISGDADIDGTTNLDAVDIDGAVQIDNTVTVGVDDTGYDVKFFGATASAYMLWDESEDDLILGGAARAVIPDGQLVLGSTAVSSTAAELNLLDGVSGLVQADFTKLAAVDATAAELNIMDGGTAASSTTLADGDRLVVNDNGTMKQVAMTDFDSDRFTITTSAPTSGSGKRTGHVWYVV
tara:strand:- start:35107 stop:37788 length:2682 start_codon:yes stop_codon:yes gene_type:complete